MNEAFNHSYQILDLIGSGSYGNVYKAIHVTTGCIVAIKIISIMSLENGLPVEVKYLVKYRNNKNIVNLIEYFYSLDDKLVLVFEFMEYDLWKFISPKNRHMNLPCVKFFIYQLLSGLNQLHSQSIMHLDIKPANLLVDQCFQLKIADFGFTTFKGNPQLTNQVISLFYRPPELLMGSKHYGPEVDIWSVGCILVEMLTGFYLFAGNSEDAQLDLIFKTMGTPNEKNWPGVSKLPGYSIYSTNKSKKYPYRSLKELGKFKYFSNATLDFILRMLAMNPMDRINCSDALVHPWFKEDPEPQSPSPYIIQSLVSRPAKSNDNNKSNSTTNNILKTGVVIKPKPQKNQSQTQTYTNNTSIELEKLYKTLFDHKSNHAEKTKYFNNQVIEYNKKVEHQRQQQEQQQHQQQQQQDSIKLQELKNQFNKYNLEIFNSVEKLQNLESKIIDLRYKSGLLQIQIQSQHPPSSLQSSLQIEMTDLKNLIIKLQKEKEDLQNQKKSFEYYIQKFGNEINQLDEAIKRRKLHEYQQQIQKQQFQQKEQEEIARQKKIQQEKIQMETFKLIKLVEDKNCKIQQNLDNEQKIIERDIQSQLNYLIKNNNHYYNWQSQVIQSFMNNSNSSNSNISSSNNSNNSIIHFLPIPNDLYLKYADLLSRQKTEAQFQYHNLKTLHNDLSKSEALLTTIYKLNQMNYDVEILYIKKQNQLDNLKRDQENKIRLRDLLLQLHNINEQQGQQVTITTPTTTGGNSAINTRYKSQLQKSSQDQLDKRKESIDRSIQSLIPVLYKVNNMNIHQQTPPLLAQQVVNVQANNNQQQQQLILPQPQLLQQQQVQSQLQPQLQPQPIHNISQYNNCLSNCTTPNFQPAKAQSPSSFSLNNNKLNNSIINSNSNNNNNTIVIDSRSSSVSPNNNSNYKSSNIVGTSTVIPNNINKIVASNVVVVDTFNTILLQKNNENSSASSSSSTSDDEDETIKSSNSLGRIQNGSLVNINNKRTKDSEFIVSESLEEKDSKNDKKKDIFTPSVPPTRYQKRLKLLNEQSVPSIKSSKS